MNIYALKGSSECPDTLASLESGEGRFGWSDEKTADLYLLKDRVESKGWNDLSGKEKACYQIFLLDLQAGDYVVYINIPEWGKCTLAKVNGPYKWRYEDKDFNHRFPVDPDSIQVFDRNDKHVHPALSARLKLQRRWWRIYLEKEFAELLSSLNSGDVEETRTPAHNLKFLSKEIQPLLAEITNRIHHTHPNTDLEILMGEVFKEVPGVVDVQKKGGAGDHGADLLVKYKYGLPVVGLEQDHVLVVQVKSFEGEHFATQAVDDIRRAFEHYPQAKMGLIVSTASSSTEQLDAELNKLVVDEGKDVALLVGSELSVFILRYGAKLLG